MPNKIRFIIIYLLFLETDFAKAFSSEISTLKNELSCNKSEFFSVNNLKCSVCDPAKNLVLSADSKQSSSLLINMLF